MISDTGRSWLRSSIGKKVLMAASGLVLVGFVVMHLAGNLLIFGGRDALNAYGVKLRDYGALLWAARGVLIAAVVIHIITSIQLSLENRRARPQPYARLDSDTTSLAARTMLLSGVLLLAYLAYHLLHLTFGVTDPVVFTAKDPLGRHDIYGMVVRGFRNPWISLAYLAGVGCVCLHLSHGIGSMAQTLGLNNERTIPIMTWTGRILSLLLFLGYAAIPVAVLAGAVR
jgi:succinate dehydrogenase / fumarate reductase cytochrome b subunit